MKNIFILLLLLLPLGLIAQGIRLPDLANEATTSAEGDWYYTVQGNVSKKFDFVNLQKAMYSDIVSYTSCTYNATTYFTLGPTSTDVLLRLHYIAERNTGTVCKEAGTIDILYDDVSGLTYYSSPTIGVDLKMEIQSDVSGGDIRLLVIVDNTYSANVLFDYKIISRFYE